MKRLLILLLLLPSLAWGSDLGQDYARMNPYILGGGASAAADGPNAWYFSCTATPTSEPVYDTGGSNVGPGALVGSPVTIAASGTLTKIKFKRHTSNTDSSAFKLAVYDTGGNYQTGMTCTVGATTSTDWLECTLSSGVAISAGTYAVVNAGSANNMVWYNNYTDGYNNFDVNYAAFPAASYVLGSYDGRCMAYALYVD